MNSSTEPTTKPAANDACWCGSGRKYKRCHRPLEGRVMPGVISPMRYVPDHIVKPDYADSGIVGRWDEPRIKDESVIARMREAGSLAAEILRLAGEQVRPMPMNRMFLGNPGTGKVWPSSSFSFALSSYPFTHLCFQRARSLGMLCVIVNFVFARFIPCH